ncbi:MauE/DoxX family redox-associated membrane protein [Thermomonospora umbrina]|uniref:Methylamine utilization protein MauE n=1 Tax=Thermomonospora umbrina TaxID=111806 RepID=A0A3D9SND0_9ACTN|nr:MauE/DoxX family redox-associated membrane protein [Thermomonospora umbrina]REE97452.1 methylamine utilization protein MauE [Thermomonospora umbrina]
MMNLVNDVQVLLLATVLAFAGIAKLLFPEPEPVRPAEIHGVPIPEPEPGWALRLRHSRPVGVTLGLAETMLGIGLLVTAHTAVRTAAMLLLAAATWVVAELRERTPDVGCGCLGGLFHEQVGRRSVFRTALLTAVAVGTLGGANSGVQAAQGGSWQVWLLFGAELSLLAALSPEPVALLRRAQRPAIPCERRRSPLAESHATLWDSPQWDEHCDLLASREPLDVWREGCWRFLAYPARRDGREIEVVFAVSTHDRDREVRVAIVPAEARFLSAPVPADVTATPPLLSAPVPEDVGVLSASVAEDVAGAPRFLSAPVSEDDAEDTGPHPRYVMAG